ncbi:hypothetical protein Tco_0688740 [Tanacetum coccineum]
METENPIRTLRDYFRPSHEGYRNTIELPQREQCGVTAIRHHLIEIATGGKLRDRNVEESWEIIKNLALYDNENWSDSRDFIKPVKAISLSQNISKTQDRRLLELEDQINFLLKGPQTTPKTSSTHIPQAYTNVVSSDPHPRNLDGPPRQNSFAFQKRVRPYHQPQALEPSFEAQVQGYMVAHTERMERFEKAIFKQREEIKDGMVEIFGLLKELTSSRAPEIILVKEEVRHPITKHINSISLIRMEEEKSVESNEVVGKKVVEPNKSDITEPIMVADRKGEIKDGTNDKPDRSAEKGLMGEKVRELVETPRSQPVKFYLKHKINKELIEGLLGNQRFNDSLLAMQSGKMECEAYHSLPIEPMCKAMLMKMITKKEDMGYFCKFEEREKDEIDPITPISIVSKRILEWEERIKFHQEKELEFNQWRGKMFNDKNSATKREDVILDDEGGVT